MAAEAPNRTAPNKLARTLLSERAAFLKAQRYRAEIETRIKGYEARYGIKSRFVHAAINRGELTENQEVCRWLLDYDLLKRSKVR